MEYRELRAALVTKGEAREDRGKDHVFFYIEVDGKRYRATKISHSARGQIDAAILGAISRQMRLTASELRSFVACRLDRERWLKLWRERGPWYTH